MSSDLRSSVSGLPLISSTGHLFTAFVPGDSARSLNASMKLAPAPVKIALPRALHSPWCASEAVRQIWRGQERVSVDRHGQAHVDLRVKLVVDARARVSGAGPSATAPSRCLGHGCPHCCQTCP